MKPAVLFASVPVFLFTTSLSTSRLQPAEGVVLKPFVHKGDQWSSSVEFDLDLSTQSEKDEEQKSWKLQRRDKFDSEVLEAREDLVSKLRRDYSRSTAKLKTKLGKAEASEKQEETPFHQTSLTLHKDGDATKLSSGGGKLSEELKSSLEIDLISSLFLPTAKVEDGKEWNLEGKKLNSFLRQQIFGAGRDLQVNSGTLKTMFKGMKEEKGKKFAEISSEGELSSTLSLGADGNYPVVIALKGNLRFDTTTARPVSFQCEAKVEGKEDAEKKIPALQGSLRFSLEVEDVTKLTGDAMKLLARFHTGDTSSVTNRSVFELNFDEISIKLNGKPMDFGNAAEQQNVKVTTTIKNVDETLEASEGEIKKLKREYQSLQFEMEGPQKDVPNPMEELDGKVVILERDGGETSAKVEGGSKIDEKILKGLTFGDEFKHFLPTDEVKVGSTWNPDEKKLIEMFTKNLPGAGEEDEEAGMDIKALLKNLNGGVTCKLASVGEEEGVPTARITIKIQFSMDLTQDDLPKAMRSQMGDAEVALSISGKMDGELLFDHKSGKPIKLEMSGPLKFKMQLNQGSPDGNMQIETKMQASGNMEMGMGFKKGRVEK